MKMMNGSDFTNGIPSLKADKERNDMSIGYTLGKITTLQQLKAQEQKQKEMQLAMRENEAAKMESEAYQMMSMVSNIQNVQSQQLQEMQDGMGSMLNSPAQGGQMPPAQGGGFF